MGVWRCVCVCVGGGGGLWMYEGMGLWGWVCVWGGGGGYGCVGDGFVGGLVRGGCGVCVCVCVVGGLYVGDGCRPPYIQILSEPFSFCFFLLTVSELIYIIDSILGISVVVCFTFFSLALLLVQCLPSLVIYSNYFVTL